MQNVLESEYQFAYEMYLIDQEYEERLHSFIYNSILKEDYLVEGQRIDAFKEFIAKIIESIKNAFSKFVEKIKDIFRKDEDYFKKYQNVIDTVSPLKANITNFYEYDINKLQTSKLPKLDLEKVKKFGSEDEFIKAYFPDFVPSNGQKFTDKIKEVFRGGEAKTVDASTLAIKPMYDFIKGYDKLVANMNKDISMIDDAGTIVKLKFKLAKNSGATAVKKEKINDSFSFEDTMYYYFTEDESTQSSSSQPQVQPANNQPTTTQSNVSSTVKKVEPSINSSGNSNDNDNSDKFDANKFNAEISEQEAKENEENEKASKMYFNVCSQFLSMRFAMAQEAYKTYAKIIKWHVDQWVKEHDGDRSGKVEKSKSGKATKEKITKDTKFYYKDEKGDWFEVTPSSDKDAKAMADPNYEYKADDGKTYKLSREIKQDEPKENEKDKYKTNPVKVYLVDDDGFAAMNNGKPKYYIANTRQKYADWFAPGKRFKYDGRDDWKPSLKPGKIPKEEDKK